MDESRMLVESDPTIRRMVASLIGERHPDYQDWLQESRIVAVLTYRTHDANRAPWRPRLIQKLRWFLLERRKYRKWNWVQQPITGLDDISMGEGQIRRWHYNRPVRQVDRLAMWGAATSGPPEIERIALRLAIERAVGTAGADAAALWAYCRGERLHLAQRHQRAVESLRPLLMEWRD